jgi:PEP-CTERM motif-containing protein
MFTSKSKTMSWRLFFAAAVVSSACFLLMPSARADIVEVEAATSCPGSVGGGLCNGLTPFDLTTLTSAGITNVSGTEKFVVTDTIGSFSFTYFGSSGDNGSCQINGGATSFFNGCTGVNSDGSKFSLGHDDTNHPGMDPPTVITFTALPGQCTVAHPCSFDLGFISWQGIGLTTTRTVPEPSSLSLLAAGLLGLIVFSRPKHA